MSAKTTPLEELCELVVDCPHSTPKWKSEGVIVLRNQNIRNGQLDLSSPSYTDEEGYQSRIKRAVPQAGDIVFTREAPMGEVCLIPEGLKCCLGQRQVLLRPKKEISGEYLYWALQSPFVQHQISWNEGTGTTVSNVRIPVLKSLEIPRQSEHEQSIANILGALSERIQSNHQINQTLEKIAQAIFKSWFVDFEPVKAKIAALEAGGSEEDALFTAIQAISGKTTDELARLQAEQPDRYADLRATAELFPSTLEDSELGGIPEGWDTCQAHERFEITIGKTPPRKEPHWFTEDPKDIKWLSIKGMGDGNVFSSVTEEYLIADAVAKHNVKICPPGTVLLSFKLTLGRVMICSSEMTTNEAIAHFRINDDSPGTYWTYLWLSSFDYSSLGSTSSIATAVNSKTIKGMQFVVPNPVLLNYFESKMEPIFQQIQTTQENSCSLAELRDALLPKLLTGELELPDKGLGQSEEAAHV